MATKAVSRAERARHKARQQHRQVIHRRWAERHPELALQERELKRDNEAAVRDFSHRRYGTVETLQHASRTRQGAMARLYTDGHLSADQLAASQAIRAVAERIGADVAIGTVSLETRVDQGRPHDGTFFEKLGWVRAEVAYSQWRRWMGPADAAIALEMVVQDVSPSAAAKVFRKRRETCRKVLIRALDLWGECIGNACDQVDEATLLAAQAAIL